MENNIISLKELSKKLKYMQLKRKNEIAQSEEKLRNRFNVRLNMGEKNFSIDYAGTLSDVIEIIITKKEYGYSNFEPGHIFYFNHSIYYDVKNDKFSWPEDDPLAKRIAFHNQRELRIICKKVLKDNYLDKNISYDVFNKGRVSVELNGGVTRDNHRDKLNKIYVTCDELPNSFQRALSEYEQIKNKKR